MGKVIKIGDRLVGEGQPAFIIAEGSTNHNGDLGRAKELVSAAKETGADCIKFQTFTPEEFCADPTKTFTYQSQGKEVTESELEMFKRLEFSQEQWAELMEFCEQEGILFLTTIQDPQSLKMMLDLGLKGIKVGSDDFDHLVYLRQYAATGLPLIVSKGMSDLGEIDRVVNDLRPRTDNLAVMHCVSLYPSDPKFLNIRQVPKLAALYPDIVWGFSDHSQGTLASTLAVTMGAKIIEKHFTLSHDLPGPDHWFSMDVGEMGQLVRDIRFAEAAMGDGEIKLAPGESESRTIMRRRVVAGADLTTGTVLDENSVSFKRADVGSFISNWELIKGHKLNTDKSESEGITFADIDFQS
jgi:N,N'-diacetyllegionaminate synthase